MTGRTLLRRLILIPALILAPVLMLAACSGGTAVPSVEVQLIETGRAMIAARRAPKTERPPLTRAALDGLDGSFLEATLERSGRLAYLYVNAQRRDGGPGLITVWRTEDNVTLATRNGVLIATRGLGGDVLSSAVQVRGTAPGPATGGEKVQYIAALDNKAVRLALACERVDLGPATIVIVERAHATRHLQERCEGAGIGDSGPVVNDYWVDSRTDLVWQSRQWAGPYIGYLRLRRLTR